MNTHNFKQYAFTLALGLGFALAPGLSSFSTAQAQNNPRRQNRREVERRGEQRRNDAYHGPVDSNGNIDLNRNGIDDRYETRDGRVDINQDGRADNGPVDSNGNIDRNRNGIDDRYEVNGQVDINQNGIPDSHENNSRFGRGRGYNGNNDSHENNSRFGRGRGYNGNNSAFGNRGYNDSEFQRGYREGMTHGRADALANRAMVFNNSNHYRSGDASYRAGFEQGCSEAYQQHRNRRL
ncbi:MAG TPA: hypothetical protein VJ810_41640 [Blastocatellia bacterium]|nr:hypothetical protein [Blastocatellia bacterium]